MICKWRPRCKGLKFFSGRSVTVKSRFIAVDNNFELLAIIRISTDAGCNIFPSYDAFQHHSPQPVKSFTQGLGAKNQISICGEIGVLNLIHIKKLVYSITFRAVKIPTQRNKS